MPVSQQDGNRGKDISFMILNDYFVKVGTFLTPIFILLVLGLTQSNGLECVIQNQFSFSLFSLSFLHQILPVYKPDTEVTLVFNIDLQFQF